MVRFSLCLSAAALVCCAAARDSVVFVCAHPDDFGGVSGTGMLLAERYDVHVVDYTHGERGLGEEGYRDGSVRKMRIQEETEACRIAGVTLHWMEEIDGEAEATLASAGKLADLFRTLKPRAVIMHWPVDTHTDHVMSSAAALKAIELAKIRPEVYFHEQHHQSREFRPAYYVDISKVKDRKDRLIMCYRCQWPEDMKRRKTEDARFWGREAGVEFAEAIGVMGGTVNPGSSVFNGLPVVR